MQPTSKTPSWANTTIAPFSVRQVVRQGVSWTGRFDRVLVMSIGALILIGIVLCLAAGPVAAMRKNIANPMHFVERQMLFMVPALLMLFVTSSLSAIQARRAGVLLGGGALAMMVLTLLIGPEIKGATRWLTLAGVSLQPSEFFKPGFVMISAWLLAEGHREPNFPGGVLSLLVFSFGGMILLVQPDYGQLLLLTAIWGTMFFVAGWSWFWVAGLGGLVVGVLGFGYLAAPHVRSRIDRFFAPGSGDTYQVDQSIETIAGGGLLGHDLNQTPSVKETLPDAHTDFIFAVAGEEFGFILCAVILGLFAAIVLRSMQHALAAQSVFVRCAIVGLAAQLGYQAIVNVGVSLAVLPAKGMTLPFVSYGGSSLVATAMTAGFLLALTRRPAEAAAK